MLVQRGLGIPLYDAQDHTLYYNDGEGFPAEEIVDMDKTTAWMLRRDGIVFPCQWHYYGNADPAEVEETLYAAEWLYNANCL